MINHFVSLPFCSRWSCPMNRALKFATICAIAFFPVFLAASETPVASTVGSNHELKPINLPGATGAVALDYFAYDLSTGRLWVPASNTGSVDAIDEATDNVSQVPGFQTGEVALHGRKINLT